MWVGVSRSCFANVGVVLLITIMGVVGGVTTRACVLKMASTKLLTRYNWKARQQTKRQDLPTDTNKLVLPCKRKDGDVEVEDGSKSKKRKLTDRERKKLRKVLETKEIKKKVSVRVAALVFVFSVQL